MKRIFKKNQIIITTLAVLIIAAGYLNYSGRLFPNTTKNTQEKANDTKLANQELLDISEEDLQATTDDIESNDSEAEGQDGTPGEAVLTNGAAAATVAQAKVSREQVRAQNKETLQGIIDNTDISEDQKTDAIAQMVKLTELSEQEMAIETLLSSKGFADTVVNLTEESADVVVEASELTDANRAQIEDVVTRKTTIAPENIVITPITNK
ncbi:SpoIIIAH-like family protein [Hespellia stercorisuis]|uniref:Stage III sporulation protein AH n=1 Tax=Hespellia stercorisuis DSM 15480 TaxID=1121950 RepID=A0A1M6HNQ5_9FIRM|nr:SpoIIIAH-like family protein [Hespellia stercorisuis]SHJ23774.1 stage III sporulation protein AH [Hespellia stercorisuis DSM 15480]